MLEQNANFLAESDKYLESISAKVKNKYAQGIQEFEPNAGVRYNCIWIQWVLGYLSDTELMSFLNKCADWLHTSNSFIVIKENVSSGDENIFDSEDNCITRTVDTFTSIFNQVNKLKLIHIFKQNMPEGMLPVKCFVIQLK